MESFKIRSKGFKKFNHEEWLAIEKEITGFEMKVCLCMKKLGNEEITEESSSSLYAIGEDLYLESIRKYLEKSKLAKPLAKTSKVEEKVTNKKDKKIKKPKMKKEDELILSINIKKLEELTTKYMTNFDFTSKNASKTTYGIEREIKVEFKIVILMYLGETLCKDQNKEAAYEYIIGVSKIVNYLKIHEFYSDIYKKNIKPSETCISDLELILEKVKARYSYNPVEIFTEFPRLILQTAYSSYFPFHDVSPYKNQVDLITTVKQLYTQNLSGLVLFKSNIGTGKTTVAVALASMINSLRAVANNNNNNNNVAPIKLIFACSIEVVRHYVGRLAYNAKLSFAVGHMTDEGPKIINSWSCDKDKNPSLIITDLYTAYRLIQIKNEYILFIDEPTYEADKKNSNTLKYFNKIFSIAPKITILSSATLPNETQLKSHINYFQTVLHKNSAVSTIISQDNFVGCQIIDHAFNDYMPHNNCKTAEELRKVCTVVFNDSLLRRCFTAKSLFAFYSRLISVITNEIHSGKFINFREKYLNQVPDIKRVFDDVDKINQNSVLLLSKAMLDILIEANDDELVMRVCESSIDYLANSFEETNSNELNIDKIGTQLAHKFINGCLIATKNPLEFAETSFKVLYSEFVDAMERNVKDYFKSIQIYHDNKRDLENKYGNKEEVLAEKLKLLKIPDCFSIPDKFEINTAFHLARYCKTNIEIKPRRNIIVGDSMLKAFLSGQISAALLALLLCGVGVYDTMNDSLDETYLKAVLKFAQEGSLAFLVTNTSLAYGANFPINNVIVTKNYGETLTISTLFQILGRAGRVGYSWAANAYLNDQTISNIDYYIKHNDTLVNSEAKNLSENLLMNLGYDFNDDLIKETFSNYKKILIVYRYNDPKSIFTAILIIMYHMLIIRQSFTTKYKINLNMFFEFIKLNTEVQLTPNYKLQFRNESFSTIYFVGMLPCSQKQCILQASTIAEQVVIFENYNLMSNNIKLELPENVKIFKATKQIGIMSLALDYVDEKLGDIQLLNNDLFDVEYYKQTHNLFIKNDIEDLLPNELNVIKSFHIQMHGFNTRKKDINYKLMSLFFNLGYEEREKLKLESDDKEAYDIIKERKQIFIFDGKKGIEFNTKSNSFRDNLTAAYDAFPDRKYDIFIGLVIDRKQLHYVSTLVTRFESIAKNLDFPQRILIIYDCYLEENRAKRSVVYCYVNDGKNYVLDYMKNHPQAKCDDREALFLLPKANLRDWTLI